MVSSLLKLDFIPLCKFFFVQKNSLIEALNQFAFLNTIYWNDFTKRYENSFGLKLSVRVKMLHDKNKNESILK